MADVAIIHLCGPRLYLYEGVSFEYGYSTGPWLLTKDGEPFKRSGEAFYRKIDGWLKMSDDERERYRVGGGCQCFTEEDHA